MKIYFDILDARDVSDDEAAQAHEMLVHNAQNLMRYVKEVKFWHSFLSHQKSVKLVLNNLNASRLKIRLFCRNFRKIERSQIISKSIIGYF